MICQYAYNSNNNLVFIDDVPNGLDCNCYCPSCHEKMVAKNAGEVRISHFAHFSGVECAGYKESMLHIWSKEIITENKSLAIPSYITPDDGHFYYSNTRIEKDFSIPKTILHFSSVDVEKHDVSNDLYPDIVAVTNNGVKYWIEIFVSHKCPKEKVNKIKANNINCIELKIPNEIENKEQLQHFLLTSIDTDLKYFINYPYGDNKIHEWKSDFLNKLKTKCRMVKLEECRLCFSKYVLNNRFKDFVLKYKKDVQYALSFLTSYSDYIKSNMEQLINCNSLDEYVHVLNTSVNFEILYTILRQDRYTPELKKIPQQTYKKLFCFLGDLNILYNEKISHENNHQNSGPCEYLYAYSTKNNTSHIFCTRKP